VTQCEGEGRRAALPRQRAGPCHPPPQRLTFPLALPVCSTRSTSTASRAGSRRARSVRSTTESELLNNPSPLLSLAAELTYVLLV
jgi:hypothetical protein